MEIKDSNDLINLNRALLILTIFIIVNHKKVNPLIKKVLNSIGIKTIDYTKEENKKKIDVSRLIVLIPVFIMMYYDYHSQSWTTSVGLNRIIPGGDRSFNFILRSLGVYGVIYTFSKKLNIVLGANQFNFTEQPFIRFITLWGISYSFAKSRSGGLMGILLHFLMRYNITE